MNKVIKEREAHQVMLLKVPQDHQVKLDPWERKDEMATLALMVFLVKKETKAREEDNVLFAHLAQKEKKENLAKMEVVVFQEKEVHLVEEEVLVNMGKMVQLAGLVLLVNR